MQNLASFFNKQFNFAHTSILALALLALEKFMEMEFVCPKDKHLEAIMYSLAFLIEPTLIVLAVAYFYSSSEIRCRCCRCCGSKTRTANNNTGNVEGGQENVSLNDGGGETQKCCQTKWDACKIFLNDYKAVFFWIAIVFTDGRYVDCLMNSWSATDKNCTKTVDGPLPDCSQAYDYDVLQLSKVCGLSIILLTMAVYLCIFGSKSKRYKKIYQASLLQVTEDTIHEQTTSKQKDHVVSILESNGWKTFKVGGSDTLENLQEITILCKKEHDPYEFTLH
ncbi:uncharacterized protein [Aquarana catesbeiana]|uniref:uncharacterized protein isoform X2 n=1 Tax=Aquarana catesbeiana TaxID=8400 RepID=UPI003CC9BFA7